MTNAPFTRASKALLTACAPQCDSIMFDPHTEFGVIIDPLGEPVLNIGVPGALIIMAIAECADEDDVARTLHHPADRQEFWRWVESFKHTFDGTLPRLAEFRSLKMLDESKNAEVYGLLGLPVDGAA